mmetsp:Transcript_27167/g.55384  ORF Transcript_27167/g.55384 Transcript_27167/m.55384 type:complete len:279 (-) Transcript_27167:208-1044(-)|eukprot:CAMPEP_0181312040 /NCGR_PEP_ID=MMETSP1101-20121128/13475_1 /TAXON_ID=46948 /ORGANISM="Rhodomonas abbreviata, Strain Caron Lab Isolate" /LENGTH=278 /DNA_ID=CAMNT_0023418845 /DNA_START=130 /DNA_END=966 /DNA_ORIENTATION=+
MDEAQQKIDALEKENKSLKKAMSWAVGQLNERKRDKVTVCCGNFHAAKFAISEEPPISEESKTRIAKTFQTMDVGGSGLVPWKDVEKYLFTTALCFQGSELGKEWVENVRTRFEAPDEVGLDDMELLFRTILELDSEKGTIQAAVDRDCMGRAKLGTVCDAVEQKFTEHAQLQGDLKTLYSQWPNDNVEAVTLLWCELFRSFDENAEKTAEEMVQEISDKAGWFLEALNVPLPEDGHGITCDQLCDGFERLKKLLLENGTDKAKIKNLDTIVKNRVGA